MGRLGVLLLIIDFTAFRTWCSRTTQRNFRSTRFVDLNCTRTISAPLRRLVKLTVNTYRTQDLIGFRTEHDLRPSRHSVDFYTFHAFAFAIDPITNLPVNITRFAVAGPLDDFMTDSRGTLTVGAPVYGGNGDSTMAEIETQVFEYRPPKSFWASIMCLLVKSWALALVSACVSLVAVMKGRVNLAGIVPHGFTALVTLGLWKGLFGRQLFGAYLGNG